MRDKLIALRRASGMTQNDMAQKIGVSLRHYKGLEAGTTEGSVKVWKQIARVFNTTIDILIEQHDEPTKSSVAENGMN